MHPIPGTAIVTGAGSGIGKAAALALLQDGWNVVLAGRRASVLEAVAATANASERAYPVATDVTDPQQVQHLFASTIKRYGRLDLLFNNAGMSAPNLPLEELALDDWRQVLDVNLTGMFLCLQQAFRVMKNQNPQGGRIINNGSIAAYTPRPNTVAYTATKHAVAGLTKSGALEGRKYRIAVGQIDIGNAATDMATSFTQGVLQADGRVAVEPVMDVALVGQSIRYMASLPLEANVLFHTIMATNMPYIGRG